MIHRATYFLIFFFVDVVRMKDIYFLLCFFSPNFQAWDPPCSEYAAIQILQMLCSHQPVWNTKAFLLTELLELPYISTYLSASYKEIEFWGELKQYTAKSNWMKHLM